MAPSGRDRTVRVEAPNQPMTVLRFSTFRPLVVWLFMLALAAIACGGSQGGAGEIVPGPTDLPAPSLEGRPDALAREFLDHVRARRFKQAHRYLGTGLQTAMTAEEFSQRLDEALKTGSTRLAYENRWVQSERIEGPRALVTVSDRKYPQVQPWTWEFWLEAGEWRVRTLDLPPVLHHQAP